MLDASHVNARRPLNHDDELVVAVRLIKRLYLATSRAAVPSANHRADERDVVKFPPETRRSPLINRRGVIALE